jgi:hypothetical protein
VLSVEKLPQCTIILSGSEFAALGRHTAAATILFNNFLLWSESDYLDAASTTSDHGF